MGFLKKITNFFNNISIKTKILFLSLFIILCYLLYVSIYFSIKQKNLLMKNLEDKGLNISQIVSYSVSAGLSFMDADAVSKALESAKNLEDISFIAVYDSTGNLFSSLNEKNIIKVNINKIKKKRILFKNNKMIVGLPVESMGAEVGFLISGFDLKRINKSIRNNILLSIGITIIISIILFWFIKYFSKLIINPINKLIKHIKIVSEGNLEQEIKAETKDEIGNLTHEFNEMRIKLKESMDEKIKRETYLREKVEQVMNKLDLMAEGNLADSNIEVVDNDDEIIKSLKNGINKMVENLKNIINQLKISVTEISSSSTEIASTNEEITLKANEEINLVSEASSTVTELTASIRQIADNSNKVSEKSNESLKTVQDEYKHIGETINKIRETNKIVQKASEDLMKLNESATKIQDILNIINKIGERTDLLALNAAIEASEAGEAGKRFRVVADEMRRLADNTIKSSKEIEEVLTTIQKGIGDNVDLMKNNAKEMAEVMLEMDKIGETMKNIVQTFEEAVGLMKEVSLATNQQAEGAEMFSNVIEQVNVAANDTVKGIENSKTSIEKFLEISNRLKEIVDRFKV